MNDKKFLEEVEKVLMEFVSEKNLLIERISEEGLYWISNDSDSFGLEVISEHSGIDVFLDKDVSQISFTRLHKRLNNPEDTLQSLPWMLHYLLDNIKELKNLYLQLTKASRLQTGIKEDGKSNPFPLPIVTFGKGKELVGELEYQLEGVQVKAKVIYGSEVSVNIKKVYILDFNDIFDSYRIITGVLAEGLKYEVNSEARNIKIIEEVKQQYPGLSHIHWESVLGISETRNLIHSI